MIVLGSSLSVRVVSLNSSGLEAACLEAYLVIMIDVCAVLVCYFLTMYPWDDLTSGCRSGAYSMASIDDCLSGLSRGAIEFRASVGLPL